MYNYTYCVRGIFDIFKLSNNIGFKIFRLAHFFFLVKIFKKLSVTEKNNSEGTPVTSRCNFINKTIC